MTQAEDNGPVEREGGGPKAMSRVLRLLDCLAHAPEGLSLADLSAALSAPKSTLLNSLKPLAAEGFLVAEGNLYRLGPRAFRLAADISSAWSLPRMLRGFLQSVSDRTRESAALAVLDHEMRRIVFIDTIESPQPVRYASRIGMSGPLHATAAGRVLLAFQPAGLPGRLSRHRQAGAADRPHQHRSGAAARAARGRAPAGLLDQLRRGGGRLRRHLRPGLRARRRDPGRAFAGRAFRAAGGASRALPRGGDERGRAGVGDRGKLTG